MQAAPQRLARLECLAKARGAHLHRRSAALNQRPHRRGGHAQRERDPDHAFAPHQPDFERIVTVDHRQE